MPVGKIVEVLNNYEPIVTIPASPRHLQDRFFVTEKPRGFFGSLLRRSRTTGIKFAKDSVRSDFTIAAATFGDDQEFALVQGPMERMKDETAIWLPKGMGITAAEHLVRRVLAEGRIGKSLVRKNVKKLNL